jgi:hypothetical protein
VVVLVSKRSEIRWANRGGTCDYLITRDKMHVFGRVNGVSVRTSISPGDSLAHKRLKIGLWQGVNSRPFAPLLGSICQKGIYCIGISGCNCKANGQRQLDDN